MLNSRFKTNLSFIVKFFVYPSNSRKHSIDAIHHPKKLKMENQIALSGDAEKINVAKLNPSTI